MRGSRFVFFVGLAFFIIEAILSLLYYKERLVLPDCANYLFDLASNGGHLAIFHHRFIAGSTQLLPFFAIKAHCELGTVARLYSLNLALFPLLCFLLCYWPRPNPKAALVLLLSQALITTDIFYWTVTELNLALALACVGLAWLDSESYQDRKQDFLLMTILAALAFCLAFAHPIVLFALGFMLLYLFWIFPKRRKRILAFGGFYLISLIIQTLTKDEYEGKALGGLRNIVTLFPDYFSTPSMQAFLRHATGTYVWLILGFAAILIFYFLKKEYWKAATFFAGCFGFLMLVTICFPEIPGYEFYQENLYLVLAFIVVFPLVFEVLPAIKEQRLTHLLIAIIIVSALFRIQQKRSFFTEKLDWKRRLIQQYSGRKMILDEQRIGDKNWFMSWSLPYEFWLLSTLEQKNTSSILITETPERFRENNGPKVFLTPFWTYRYEDLPAPYFQFRDSTHTYEVFE